MLVSPVSVTGKDIIAPPNTGVRTYGEIVK